MSNWPMAIFAFSPALLSLIKYIFNGVRTRPHGPVLESTRGQAIGIKLVAQF